jgi:tetratricopeptide (TPR) repeat protein
MSNQKGRYNKAAINLRRWSRCNRSAQFYCTKLIVPRPVKGNMRMERMVRTLGFVLAIALGAPAQQPSPQLRQQHILQVQNLIQNDDIAAARTLLDGFMAESPNDSGLENLLGIVAAGQGDSALAERSFRQAIQHNSKFTAAHLNLARLYQETMAGDPEHLKKALREYESVLTFESGNSEANYQAALLLMQQNHYRESLAKLAKLGASARTTPQVLSVELADDAGLGEARQATALASQLVAHSDMTAADVQQAVPGLTAGKRFDLIAKLLEAVQQRQPLSDEMLSLLGKAYEDSGSDAHARETFEALFQRNPSSTAPLLALAELAHKQHDYQGSLGYLAHAQDLEPENANISYSFGLVCLDLNLLAEAQRAFKKAVDRSPDNATYNYSMGMATSFLHEPGEGIPYLEKYRRLRPDDRRGDLALGMTHFRAKEFDAAGPYLSRAAEESDLAAMAHYYLARVAIQEDRPEDGFQELQLSLKAKPDYADALAELGQMYLMQKKYPEAVAALQKAIQLDPNHFSANFSLLTVYLRTKDARQAQQAHRFEEIQKLSDQKKEEYLRVIEVRPLDVAK